MTARCFSMPRFLVRSPRTKRPANQNWRSPHQFARVMNRGSITAKPTAETSPLPTRSMWSADEVRAMSGASARTRADAVFNRFFAISNPEGKRHPLLPGIFMAETVLDDDDPNSALHSWERTFLVTEDWLYKAAAFGMPLDGVNAAVYLARREFANKDWRRPSLTFRGEPLMEWGDRVTPKMAHAIDPSAPDFDAAMQSDLGLGIANKPFRVLSVSDTYEWEHAGARQYTTTAECVPLSTDGY